MRKQVWMKGLIGILCTVLLFINVLSTGVQVFAVGTDASVVDKSLDEENTENDTDGADNEETVDDVKKEEQGEEDSVGKVQRMMKNKRIETLKMRMTRNKRM